MIGLSRTEQSAGKFRLVGAICKMKSFETNGSSFAIGDALLASLIALKAIASINLYGGFCGIYCKPEFGIRKSL